MRIVIDMQGAQSESRFRGIGRYSLSLALAIVRNSGGHDILLALNGALPESILNIRNVFKGLIAEEKIYIFELPQPIAENDIKNQENTRISELLREYFLEQLNPDVILVTSLFEGYVDNAVTSVGNFSSSKNTAVILYDLIPYLDKKKYLPEKHQYDYYMRKIESLKNANLLLSISKYSKEEACQTLSIDKRKIQNIYTAVDESFCHLNLSTEEIQSLYNKYNLKRKILMYAPGGFDVRKNFEGLIEAYGQLSKGLRSEYQLVIVSKIQDGDRFNLNNIAKKFGLYEDELILTGYVSDEDLIALYNTATLFIFPSKHEGFGLPVLEAMACGTPVIGSNTTSIPEVIGWKEALFNPESSSSIAKKIEEVLNNKDFKNKLVEKQKEHKKIFSWDISGKQALSAMETYIDTSVDITHENWEEKLHKYERNYALLIKKVAFLIKKYDFDDNNIVLLSSIISKNEERLKYSLKRNQLSKKIIWRIEGPFDSSYSLALLNRETALAMNKLGHDVILHSTEGPGDFEPSSMFLSKNPELNRLYQKSIGHSQLEADVSSRNLYPPRVNDMKSRINMLHHYAWEESGFPSEWVNNFNQSLQGITCLSKHVEKVMLDNGVTVPLITSSCGVDHWEKVTSDINYRIKDKHSFKFLHVSSCFPRKGADILLKAYGKSFSLADDVVLVIKTFQNPHNEIHKWLKIAKENNKNYPDVLIIEDDLTEEELKAVYEQCDALVGPSRAEGFGLPFAEAMLSGLPVITTGWSGQLDFCSNETAWLINYDFTPAETHFELFNSVWAEPSVEHLASLLREVYELPEVKRKEKSKVGRELLLNKFKWTDVVARLIDSAQEYILQDVKVEPKIGWVTSWNTKCGIATYSEHLINAMYQDIEVLAGHTEELTAVDKSNVHRCWNVGEDDALLDLENTIDRLGLDTLVIQFNYGFFNFETLNKFIDKQSNKNRTIVFMLHATKDPIHAPHKRLEKLVSTFSKCDRLLVHAHGDLNRLKKYNLIRNVALFPHGILDWSNSIDKNHNKIFTIASYGFFLPHKGLIELIEAIAVLVKKDVKVQLKMVNAEYPVPESKNLIKQAKEKIKSLNIENNIELYTDFLSDSESLKLLGEADLIVFPYQETGESSSAAVRYGLATEKPITVTPLAIFDDVNRAVFKLPGTTVQKISEGIETLMGEIIENSKNIQNNKSNADEWREAYRYSSLGLRLGNILLALNNANLRAIK
jgi:glycosyltransferase involved in cell wall biosynthesis